MIFRSGLRIFFLIAKVKFCRKGRVCGLPRSSAFDTPLSMARVQCLPKYSSRTVRVFAHDCDQDDEQPQLADLRLSRRRF